ncbi:Predicted N-acetyltransferase YhbS [Zhouia amylolytica]|uniref:Predicted N-acetyltransferase YhbS n=1 Tax=Zhouia amylolytica TaxID=376730 RepID=A0A1I6TW40_9FLAO|nr:N-acetyltransferase [Zhouia amylolytica]MCQ0112529.1 N-acetyltransferase [Zhouia amylolytica]SFS93453.1 Predicted N-acetyltransferase YhbS [Zhouia amylolytica]
MKHSLYRGGRDNEIIALFRQTFTDSESEKEGNHIGTLVKQFLEHTPNEGIRVFITTKDDQVVSGVIFSKLTFEDCNICIWLLSPAAVVTSMQGKGVGQGLIRFAHDYLKQEGVQQLVTYGDINFYSKVGYKPITEEIIPSPLKLSYPEGWLAQSLESEHIKAISGKVYCVEAINRPELW